VLGKKDVSVVGTGVAVGGIIQFPSILDAYAGYKKVPYDFGFYISGTASSGEVTMPSGQVIQVSVGGGGGLGRIHGNYDGHAISVTGMYTPVGATVSVAEDKNKVSYISDININLGAGYGLQIGESITGVVTIRDVFDYYKTHDPIAYLRRKK